MFCREGLPLVAGLALLSVVGVFQGAEAHPGCVGDVSLGDNLEASFCPTDADPLYAEGFCCDVDLEADIMLQLSASSASGSCASLYQEVRKYLILPDRRVLLFLWAFVRAVHEFATRYSQEHSGRSGE